MKGSSTNALRFLLGLAAILLLCGGAALAQDVEALKPGEALVWRYLDNPSDLDEIRDTSWTLPGYDDSRWAQGSGAFGANDGRLEAVEDVNMPSVCLRMYLPDGDTIPVYYFRLSFTPEKLTEALYEAKMIYDDAAIVYLNGEVIHEGNVREGGYEGHPYGAANTHYTLPEDAIQLEPDRLLPGENVLAVELHQVSSGSSDIFFSMTPFDVWLDDAGIMRRDSVCLGVGDEEGEVYVTWQGVGKTGRVELAEGVESEEDFPRSPDVFKAEWVCENPWKANTFRATLTGLKPGRTYAYRVVDEDASKVFTFTLPEEGDFCFIAAGDPQISQADKTWPMEIYDRLIAAAAGDDDPAFLLTLGDQSDDEDDEALFLRYLSSSAVKSLPVAAIVGNHEDYGDYFSRFFTLPNMDEETIDHSGDMSGDYWFGHEGLLVLCINTNNSDDDGHAEALARFKEAYVREYGEPDWIIAAFHHSLYSVGKHAASDDMPDMRDAYIPLFEELGVDVVFAGRDHRYVRSYPIKDQEIIDDSSDHLVDPEGIVYMTLGSSTGTKFYDDESDAYDYDLVVDHESLPAVTRVDVESGTLSITTFCLSDGEIEILDEVTIEKTGR